MCLAFHTPCIEYISTSFSLCCQIILFCVTILCVLNHSSVDGHLICFSFFFLFLDVMKCFTCLSVVMFSFIMGKYM